MRLLRVPEVIRRTGEPRPCIYRGIQAGTFPRPVKIGRRSVAWVESEIDAWIEAKVAARDEAA